MVGTVTSLATPVAIGVRERKITPHAFAGRPAIAALFLVAEEAVRMMTGDGCGPTLGVNWMRTTHLISKLP